MRPASCRSWSAAPACICAPCSTASRQCREIDPEIRAAVRALPVAEAHAIAHRLDDPNAGARSAPGRHHPRRPRARGRALHRPAARYHGRTSVIGGIGRRSTLRPMILLPRRDWLMARCDRGFDQMVEGAQVAKSPRLLLARHLDPDAAGHARSASAKSPRGWREIDRDGMLERGCIATRQYAKRQYTWFANQPPPTGSVRTETD
jgi:tRNA dimethylallyltransferase